MNAEEGKGEMSLKAQEKEFRVLQTNRLFGFPVHGAAIKNPKATYCGLAMLKFIKHVEHTTDKWVYKGRAVILGDNLRYVDGGKPISQCDHWWEKLASSPASLEESRTIDAYAVISGNRIETVDFEAAYLQTHWPSEPERAFYIAIPKILWQWFTDQKMMPSPSMKFPLWPVQRAGYGHPASGHLWCNTLVKFLLSCGWVAVGRPGKGCLFAKGSTLIVVYVDDMKACGPPDELSDLWQTVGGQSGEFKWKEKPAPITEFLGAEYERKFETRDGVEMDVLHVGLTNYIRKTVEAWQTLCNEGVKARPHQMSASANIRPDWLFRVNKPAKTEPVRAHQIIIGRLLWIYRTCRPDIGQAVSGLGSRVACWDATCDQQLKDVIGYLGSTAETKLEFAWPVELQGRADSIHAEIHADADWRGSEKSQSSFVSWLRPAQLPSGKTIGGCNLHWMSKKQTLTADSAADSEIVAAHLAFKEGSWPLMTILAAFGRDERDYSMLVDNRNCQDEMDTMPCQAVALKKKALYAKAGYLRDLHDKGMFHAGRVASEYNRADAGTKVPASSVCQTWWRGSLGLQESLAANRAARELAWRATNGQAPPKTDMKDPSVIPTKATTDPCAWSTLYIREDQLHGPVVGPPNTLEQ